MPSFRVSYDADSSRCYVYCDWYQWRKELKVPFYQGLLDPAALDASGKIIVSNDFFSLWARHDSVGELRVAEDVWTFTGDDYRAPIVSAFDHFVEQLEAQEGKALLPNTSPYLRLLLAACLPMTFAESLYFRYGLLRRSGDDPQFRVDLQAGMRLRVDYQQRQFIPPVEEGFSTALNGFVGGAQAHYTLVEDLDDRGRPRVGFDPFLGNGPFPLIRPAEGGAGGIIDLSGSQHRRRYLRLCVPSRFPADDSPGYVGSLWNFALLGADDLKTLNEASDAFFKTGVREGWQDRFPALAVNYFRGRAVPVPEINCLNNACPFYVSVGTSVRQVLEHLRGPLPRLPNLTLKGRFKRNLPGGRDARASQPVLSHVDVSFDSLPPPPDLSRPITTDPYDLPVWPADDFSGLLG